MATLIQLTALSGSALTMDAELIDPATDVASMSAVELRRAGTMRGTRVTPSGGPDRDVQESVEEVKTIVRAALALGPSDSPAMIGEAVYRDGMPAAQEVFNAAGPAAITGLSLTGLPAGSYLFMLSGTADSSDVANCGATFQIARGGVGIGTQLAAPAPTFGANSQVSKGLGQMGLQLQVSGVVPADVWTVLVGVVPGGVGGDDITVTDVTLTAIRLS